MAAPTDDSATPEKAVRGTVFWQPRHGHADEEYEDAFALSPTEAFPVRAAVADGATESAYARDWAALLADGIVAQEVSRASALRAALPAWQKQWQRRVAGQASRQPWYAAAKTEQGAFATVLGLTLRADGTWQALSVGDCALFHVRRGALRAAWPVDDPDAFTQRPALVPSRGTHALPAPEETTGTWVPGDAFLLATDAAAAWLLRTDPVAVLALDDDTFPARIRAAREAGRLRNDDVTILTLRMRAA